MNLFNLSLFKFETVLDFAFKVFGFEFFLSNDFILFSSSSFFSPKISFSFLKEEISFFNLFVLLFVKVFILYILSLFNFIISISFINCSFFILYSSLSFINFSFSIFKSSAICLFVAFSFVKDFF